MKRTRAHAVQLRTDRGIALDVRGSARSLVKWLRSTVAPTHTVVVFQKNAEALVVHDNTVFGVFRRPKSEPGAWRFPVSIIVAAGIADAVQEECGSRNDGIDAYLHTILHEWAHFEEWRDGLGPDEQRANARADELLAAFRELHPITDGAA